MCVCVCVCVCVLQITSFVWSYCSSLLAMEISFVATGFIFFLLALIISEKVMATTKDDLTRVLDHFNIQVGGD